MQIPIGANLSEIARAFRDAGVSVYAVGGLVRNSLLNLPPSDIDICSRLTPDEVSALFLGTGVRVIEKAKEFGTVELHLNGEHYEHTTFRAERYGAGGKHRPDAVTLGGTVETDAFRRDFTVNALYYDLNTGALLDPTGGLDDLDRRVLRATGEHPDTIMGSDALRVLRLVRFASELRFAVDAATYASAKRFAPQLCDIAAERLGGELMKLLLSDVRYPALQTKREGRDGESAFLAKSVLYGLTMLDGLGALDVLIPELIPCRGMEQRSDQHRYDVLTHSLHVCAETPARQELRLAGLLHDVGKPRCMELYGDRLRHAALSAEIARTVLTRLKLPGAVTGRSCALIADHMYDIQNRAKESTLRVTFARWGRAYTEDMIALREADVRGTGRGDDYFAVRWRTLYDTMCVDGTPMDIKELAVTGRDIIGATGASGAQVGKLKERLFWHAARHPGDNTRERLLCRIRDYEGKRT